MPKPCKKLQLLQCLAIFLSIHTTLCRGIFPPTEGSVDTVNTPLLRVVWIQSKIHEMQCILQYFCEEGCRYNLHFSFIFTIFCNSCFLQIWAMLTLMCSVDNGLEMKLWAFSICSAARNDLAHKLDVSALLITIFQLVIQWWTLYQFQDWEVQLKLPLHSIYQNTWAAQ